MPIQTVTSKNNFDANDDGLGIYISKHKVAETTQTAIGFLDEAKQLMVERGKQYDKAGEERSMPRCVAAFNAITGQDLSESEGWLFLQTLKDVRQWSSPDGYHEDSAKDGVAYSALKAESLARGGTRGK